MRHPIIDRFEKTHFPQDIVHPSFRPGDTIRVHYKIEEGSKPGSTEKRYRIQTFEGVCMVYRKGQASSTFVVRKMGANSVGVERVFPLWSPMIDRIDLVSGGRVRRARLYYLRDLSGKSARIKPRRLPGEALMSSINPHSVHIEKEKPVAKKVLTGGTKASKKK